MFDGKPMPELEPHEGCPKGDPLATVPEGYSFRVGPNGLSDSSFELGLCLTVISQGDCPIYHFDGEDIVLRQSDN